MRGVLDHRLEFLSDLPFHSRFTQFPSTPPSTPLNPKKPKHIHSQRACDSAHAPAAAALYRSTSPPLYHRAQSPRSTTDSHDARLASTRSPTTTTTLDATRQFHLPPCTSLPLYHRAQSPEDAEVRGARLTSTRSSSTTTTRLPMQLASSTSNLPPTRTRPPTRTTPHANERGTTMRLAHRTHPPICRSLAPENDGEQKLNTSPEATDISYSQN